MRAFAATSALVMLAGGVAVAQTDASWPQFQGGPAKVGAVSEGPAPGYASAWSAPAEPGGPGDRYGLSFPVVADGLGVAVGPEQVVAVDLVSGEQAFTVPRALGPPVPPALVAVNGSTAAVYTEGWGDGPPDVSASASSPAASVSPAGDGEEERSASRLAAVDLADRDPLWPPVPLHDVSRTGVTVDDVRAYVGVNDGTVTAVDLVEGTVAWQRPLGAPLTTALALGDGLVFAGLQGDADTESTVVALDAATGQERWRYRPSSASSVVSAVSVGGTSIFAIVSGPTQTSIVAVDLAEGAELWSRRVNAGYDVTSPPLVSGGTIIVTDLIGHVRAFEAQTGGELWDHALNAPVFRSVQTVVGYHLLVPTADGQLAALDTVTGELVWRRPPDGYPMRSATPAGELLLAVRGGAAAGFQAFEHDPEAALVREASPTTLALGPMLAAMALGVVPVVALVLASGAMLGRRRNPAGDDRAIDPLDPSRSAPGDEAPADEPRDPWEDEGPAP